VIATYVKAECVCCHNETEWPRTYPGSNTAYAKIKPRCAACRMSCFAGQPCRLRREGER